MRDKGADADCSVEVLAAAMAREFRRIPELELLFYLTYSGCKGGRRCGHGDALVARLRLVSQPLIEAPYFRLHHHGMDHGWIIPNMRK